MSILFLHCTTELKLIHFSPARASAKVMETTDFICLKGVGIERLRVTSRRGCNHFR